MRRVRLLFVAALAVAALSVPSAALANNDSEGDQVFIANLRGANEVPPTDSLGRGHATFRLDENGVVQYKLTLHNISGVFAAHIHAPAPPGANAPVRQFLCGGGGTPPCAKKVTGSFTVSPDLLVSMRSGLAYVNAHTPAHPGGEIRGQIQSDDD